MDDILDDIIDGSENDEIMDWRIYIGEQADYYIPIWDKIQSGQKITFNIYAFLFGIFWMLYRKMYRTALVVGGIMFVEVIIEESIRINMNMTDDEFQPITWATSLLINAFFALYGNSLFYNEAKKRITDAKSSTIGDYDLELQEAGGTSILSILIGIVIYVVVFLVAMMIIDPSFFDV